MANYRTIRWCHILEALSLSTFTQAHSIGLIKPFPLYKQYDIIIDNTGPTLDQSLLVQVPTDSFLTEIPHLLLGHLIFSSWEGFADLKRRSEILPL